MKKQSFFFFFFSAVCFKKMTFFAACGFVNFFLVRSVFVCLLAPACFFVIDRSSHPEIVPILQYTWGHSGEAGKWHSGRDREHSTVLQRMKFFLPMMYYFLIVLHWLYVV
jgi:hypothetical protein